MNKQNSLIVLTSLTATFVAICAAVFSVTGIAKLFAGAALSAAVMASALELGKIVSISFLYQYWKEIPKTLKTYLSVAAVILMIITSAGIYGYLSAAYAKVAATPLQLNADIQTVTNRATSVEQDIKRKEQRLAQLITLRAQQENRLDQLVSRSTTGNTTTIRSAQNSLNAADKNVTSLQNEITKLSTQRDSLNAIGIGKQVEIETNGDIGTFVYIAKMFNVPLDVVVKWFTLVIVLVFDPLAVALVIAVNFLIKNKEKIDNKREKITEEPYKIYAPKPPSADVVPNLLINEENFTPSTEVSVDNMDSIESQEPPTEMALIRPTEPQPDKLYYTAGDFDWNNRGQWENDPLAVNYYNERIKPRL